MTSTISTPTIKTIGSREAASIKATEKRAVKAAKADPKRCECDCGATTKSGDFLPGHDAKLRGVLLAKYDGGDTEAGRALVRRGWATEASLNARGDKSLDANERRTITQEARASAASQRRAALVETIDRQMAALQAKRDALVAEAE